MSRGDNHGSEQDSSTDSLRERGVSRRRLMAAGAAGWATVGLAGCSDNGGNGTSNGDTTDGDDTTQDGDDTSDVTVTSQTTTTETGTTEDSGGGGTTTTTSCTQSGVFAPGMDVGFLVSIYDTLSGDLLDDGDVDSVRIRFPNADFDPVELTPSGPHEEHVDDKWGGKLSTPIAAEAGRYRYEIEVEKADAEEPEAVATDEIELVDVGL
ncbi:MAG: hypothetical protein ABEJ55_03120 [Halanaeroarchaeum sp.]